MRSAEAEGKRAAVTADAAASDAAAQASSASSDTGAHGASLHGRTAMIVLLLAGNVLVSLMQSLMNVALDYVSTRFHVGLSEANLLIPLYLEGVAGYTPFIAGCLVAPPIVCYAAFCLLSGRILGKHGVWPLIPLGFAITLASFAVLAVTTRLDPIVGTIVGMAFAYASIELAYPAIKSVDLEVLTPAQSSSGSSIHSTLVQVASSISSALFVGIMSGRVDSAMTHGASKAAAYGDGMGVTLWIALVLLAVAVCLSVIYARRIQRTSAGA